jgi:hypothetical protein
VTDHEHQHWWQLHVRVARGEQLNKQEMENYAAGLEQLDQEEISIGVEIPLQLLDSRTRIDHLRRVYDGLAAESHELDRHIEAAETIYQQLTGRELTIVNYASS